MNQEQTQTQEGQTQEQALPPDPVQEQRQSYKAPENAIALDPMTVTEVPKVPQGEEPIQ